LVRRVSTPAAAFGSGYGFCCVQGREETAPQLLAATALGSWAGLTRSLRLLAASLPDSAMWPRERLSEVESRELRVLVTAAAECVERGLDSAPLHRVALRRLCEEAEADPKGLAVQGLGPEGEGGGLPELAAHLDGAASALPPSGGAAASDLILGLAAALHALVVAGGPSWQQELTADGVLHVAHANLVASTWLAESLRRRQCAAAVGDICTDACLSEEDEHAAAEDLNAVWQALGHARVGARLGRGRSEEAVDLHRDLHARYAALLASPPPPPMGSMRPAQDALPPRLRRSIATALRGGGGGWPARTALPTAAPVTPAAAAQEPSPADSSSSSSAFGGGGCVGAGSEGSSGRSAREKVSKLIELGAWGVLLCAGLVAVSGDGLGLLRFHALPEAWRAPVKSLLTRRAVHVEDLLAKYDLEPREPSQEPIILGPFSMQSSYIQVPENRV